MSRSIQVEESKYIPKFQRTQNPTLTQEPVPTEDRDTSVRKGDGSRGPDEIRFCFLLE